MVSFLIFYWQRKIMLCCLEGTFYQFVRLVIIGYKQPEHIPWKPVILSYCEARHKCKFASYMLEIILLLIFACHINTWLMNVKDISWK